MNENRNLAKIFSEIAIFLEMKERKSFRSLAFEKAALGIESFNQSVKDLYKAKGEAALENIPGVGKGIAKRIEEYLKTGEVKDHRRLQKLIPVNLDELSGIEGLGPKTIYQLWRKLKIRTFAQLEAAARAGKVRRLPDFGEKSEKNIIQSIEFLKRNRGRFLLGEILPEVQAIVKRLDGLKEVEKIDLAGSLRRRKETIGDADILIASSNPQKVTDFFVSLPGVVRIWGQGKTKASIRTQRGFDIDLRIIPAKSYGAALQYFTGSKEHNIVTRKIAIEKKLKLNEYGLFRAKKMIAGASEPEIYRVLGLSYIEPELRENQGEIEAAKKGELPKIIGYNDIKGDLHCHSNWDGGRDSIAELARAAQKMGYEYLGISDHTQFLKIEKGLNEKQLLAQRKEIQKINSRNSKFRILQGCEANILNDGSIDIKDEVLAQLDFVIAGIHSSFKMNKEQMTARIIRAIRNPNVDIIAHPTGRILQRRDEYQIDFPTVLKAAKETNTVLEIDSSPERLDLKDSHIRLAQKAGVKMVINTDSHSINHLPVIQFGVAQARRGWLEKADVVNCHSLEKLLRFFK